MKEIPLTKLQQKIIGEFYGCVKTKVIFNKKERKDLWKKTKAKQDVNIDEIKEKCPALAHQISKSYETGKNIQSAVFSECVYAQTLANMINLSVFANCYENHSFITESVCVLLKSYNLTPRYVYSNTDKSRMLIQAGGCHGIDSALISVIDLNIYTIEFKEPGAKICEPDLPKYDESGSLTVTNSFLDRYPQFKQMLEEQKDLNFFRKMGSNENSFSKESVNIAVMNNYVKKYADVVCTEDVNGYLIMLPSNQLPLWAEIVGEIRPAGRNHYKVWTPIALKKFITDKGGTIENDSAIIDKSTLKPRKERGGNNIISGYKINSLFFVYSYDCKDVNDKISFKLNNVRQLNPTIAAKMFFKKLKYDEVKDYYKT